MSDYTLAGEIVLRDLFSASLDKLETGARAAEGTVSKLGDEVDGIGTGAGIQPLLSQIDRLQGEAAAAQVSLDRMMKEVETTPALAKVKQLESAIASIKAKAAGGIPLSVGDVGEFQRLNSELVSLQGGLAGVQGKASGIKSAFSGIGGMLAGLGLAFGGQQILSGTVAMVKMGASAKELEDAFTSLTRASNINGQAMLSDIQKASFGTISNVDAMLIANRALLSQQGAMLSSMPQIVTYAASVANALGKSTLEVTQGIVDALATGQVRGLKEFGIVISQEDALAAAEALGQETDEMKRQEIVAQLTTTALAEMAKKQLILGENSRSTMDDIDSLTTSWQNLKVAIGEAIIEAGGADFIGRLAEGMSVSEEINKTSADLNTLNTALRDAGRSAEASALFNKQISILNDVGNTEEGLAQLRQLRSEAEGMIQPVGYAATKLHDFHPIMQAIAETGPGQLPYWAGQLDAVGGAASAAVGPFLTLEGAILRAQGASRAFATTPMKGTALETSISQVESKLSNLAGLVDSTTLTKWRDKAVQDLGTMFRNMGNTTSFGMNLMTGEYLKGWDTIGEEVRKKQTSVEKSQIKHIERLFDSSSSLKSAIEGALQGDMTVTGLDLQLSKEGKYTDKVNEAARQLQAIAERGFKELKVHPDWAAALKIPPEVLSGSEAQLKDWAGQTAQNVNANLRPDLINWDAFISNFKRGLEDNAAKNLTIDVAVGKLKEAGLLDADTQALRDQIAAQLGIKAPSLTIDTLFAADEGAGADLVKQATGPLGYLELPAMLKYITPAGTGENAGQGTTTALMPPTAIPAPTMPTGVDQVGTDMATSLLSGFNLTLANTDVGSVTLGVWSASFYAQSAGYGGIGTGMGHIMAGAFIEAMKDDFEGIQDTIAGWLLPAVERRLKRSSGGRGAID